ncbi:hypothetical protein PHYSODRAFT_333279 [Phytophthora sojae]|uniref:RxLR effector protein n=1 Tax=Phytophthora sojae (strain P6497) TaxID=1094619 RepID=G4ZMF2_PHYSP|nr:hypothetical protein PHYSODRAFT_333279 [Phytophthora sojae]EGZ15005.1 hypothetical protein PHYSODRAFT_333279 [Phytophthora sojae]|eukprot:XP_009528754.1 hypothetical protein PHYSODRAFT_333279 [Phytophthora sojae]
MRLNYTAVTLLTPASAASETAASLTAAAAVDEEERGVAIAGLENLIKTGAKKTQVQWWLTRKKSAEAAFKLFNLEGKNGLFGSLEFLAWAKYVTKLDKKNAGATMLEALLKRYDEATLARMIISAQGSSKPGLEKNCDGAAIGVRSDTIKSKLGELPNQKLWAAKDKELVHAYRYFIGAI